MNIHTVSFRLNYFFKVYCIAKMQVKNLTFSLRNDSVNTNSYIYCKNIHEFI